MPIRRRYHLRKSQCRQLEREIGEEFGKGPASFSMKAVEVVELDSGEEVVVVMGEALFFRTGGKLFPVLGALDRIPLSRVVVDMGAVPSIINGADVMSPGIVSADENISIGESVVVVDEKYMKPLAIGQALVPGAVMRGRKGKAVKNLHHVGDEIWKIAIATKKHKV